MENTIENAIDKVLESISSGLHIFSIGLGILLILWGMVLYFTKKGPLRKKGIAYGGATCLILGIIAIVSGLMQL